MVLFEVVAEGGAIGGDGECHRSTLYKWHILCHMSHRETEADGNITILQYLVKHILGAVEVEVALGVCELPQNQPVDTVEHTGTFQAIHGTVKCLQTLINIFEEDYGIIDVANVVARSCDVVEHGKISADECAPGSAEVVILVCLDGIFGIAAFENGAQHKA